VTSAVPTKATRAKSGCEWETARTEATDWGAFETVLQQGCWPIPVWQSPAIFLQHATSAALIFAFGRQASAVELIQKQTRASAMMDRNFATTQKSYRLLVVA
jgi:hypothetical protein